MSLMNKLARWINSEAPLTTIEVGQSAPGFSLKALDGKEYSLTSLLERGPVVLAFFKISCPVCQFTFPFLQRLFERYGGDGVSSWAYLRTMHAAPRNSIRNAAYN